MVAVGSYHSDRTVVGRERERDQLLSAVAGAAAGAARTVVIEGTAGMGKTALLGATLDDLARDPRCVRLHGTCLPLASLTIPFLGLRSAFSVQGRADAPPGARRVPPSPDLDAAPARVPLLLDRWIDEAAQTGPVVLAVDDLHWADPDTLDTLLYLMAGPADRAFAIIGAMRTEHDARSVPSGAWRAELRRVPRLDVMQLQPLDRAATAEQIAAILGVVPPRSLVDDVFTRTRGHPYLTELLVSGVPPDASRLPDDMPESVTSAVLGAVRLLPLPAQHLLDILALAARPMATGEIARVLDAGCETHDDGEIRALLREAVARAVLAESRPDTFWFRHPLTPELIAACVPTGELRRWHGVLAGYEASVETDGQSAFDRALRIAVHHDLSGARRPAFAASLAAATEAERGAAHGHELRLLCRALELVTDGDASARADLVARARTAAHKAGALDIEASLIEELLGGEASDLERAMLRHRLLRVRLITQRGPIEPGELEELLEVTGRHPRSWQHAVVLASWAYAGLDFRALPDPERSAGADAALAIARASGSDAALAHTLVTSAHFAATVGDRQTALALATEAIPVTIREQDWVAFNGASGLLSACQTDLSAPAAAAVSRRQRELLVAHGAPHLYVSWLASFEAREWLTVGEWRRCAEALRLIGLRDPGPYSDASARITAARLAALQGRAAEAAGHLAPVIALAEHHRNFMLHHLDAVRAEMHLCAGDSAAALACALEGLTRHEMPDMAEWLVPLAARALADAADSCRRAGTDPAGPLDRLARLQAAHPAPVPSELYLGSLAAAWDTAFDALYRAEISRAQRSADEGDAWTDAATAVAGVALRWEEAYACLRAAEAYVRGAGGTEGHGGARGWIRRGHALAGELGAAGLAASFVRLAGLVHLRLDGAAGADAPSPTGLDANPRLRGLSAREREVLALICAGRTYAEVAAELFISDKTVSAHVSHILAKTGAANRIELAWLAADPA